MQSARAVVMRYGPFCRPDPLAVDRVILRHPTRGVRNWDVSVACMIFRVPSAALHTVHLVEEGYDIMLVVEPDAGAPNLERASSDERGRGEKLEDELKGYISAIENHAASELLGVVDDMDLSQGRK